MIRVVVVGGVNRTGEGSLCSVGRWLIVIANQIPFLCVITKIFQRMIKYVHFVAISL